MAVIKEACMADARRIAGEKEDAEEDLAQAKPFLEEAERAVESIKVQRKWQPRELSLWVFERACKMGAVSLFVFRDPESPFFINPFAAGLEGKTHEVPLSYTVQFFENILAIRENCRQSVRRSTNQKTYDTCLIQR